METIKCLKCNGEMGMNEYKLTCKNGECGNENTITEIIASYYENKEFKNIIELSDEILTHVWVEESEDNQEDGMVDGEECKSKPIKIFKIKDNEEKKIIADVLYFYSFALVNLNLYEKSNEIRDAAIQLMMELGECRLLDEPLKLARLLIYRGAFYRNIGQIIWCTEDYGIALEIMEGFIHKEDLNITKKYTDLLIERGAAFEQFEMLGEALQQYRKAYDVRLNLAKKDECYIDEYLGVCYEVVKLLDMMEEHHRVMKYVEDMDFMVEGKNIIDEGEKAIIEINKIMIKAEEIERKRVAKEMKKEKGGFFSKLFNKNN
ncbi:hypothetical protein [Oceanirhabdus seepicola]|uniref:Tetratricopeptide repeat protein n=1 Tax=Oceanirhabdus seepicola TaxID=2828781 RepID=A0A9J6NXJ9_9CLOT|nr:hypothetical protein [Oceanirhabdus seepicola]MCM1988625.1 hypothetical protein [Oceanirhabdus seepicola]